MGTWLGGGAQPLPHTGHGYIECLIKGYRTCATGYSHQLKSTWCSIFYDRLHLSSASHLSALLSNTLIQMEFPLIWFASYSQVFNSLLSSPRSSEMTSSFIVCTHMEQYAPFITVQSWCTMTHWLSLWYSYSTTKMRSWVSARNIPHQATSTFSTILSLGRVRWERLSDHLMSAF